MSFLSAATFLPVAKVLRANVRSRFVLPNGQPKPLKIAYDGISVIVTSFALNYLMAPFVVLYFVLITTFRF
jgi:hypothetical protein